ncbi:MAG: PilZ domain-containing protein [Sphingomonadaceae bacterium]|nr:PilZ domain-containing protein [Sphingomonadaceae bacterium]
MFLMASLRYGEGKRAPMRVRNLSAGGLMADCKARVRIDDEVEIELRGIDELTGRVVWAHGGQVGVAFDEPIDPRDARKPVRAGR